MLARSILVISPALNFLESVLDLLVDLFEAVLEVDLHALADLTLVHPVELFLDVRLGIEALIELLPELVLFEIFVENFGFWFHFL